MTLEVRRSSRRGGSLLVAQLGSATFAFLGLKTSHIFLKSMQQSDSIQMGSEPIGGGIIESF